MTRRENQIQVVGVDSSEETAADGLCETYGRFILNDGPSNEKMPPTLSAVFRHWVVKERHQRAVEEQLE